LASGVLATATPNHSQDSSGDHDKRLVELLEAAVAPETSSPDPSLATLDDCRDALSNLAQKTPELFADRELEQPARQLAEAMNSMSPPTPPGEKPIAGDQRATALTALQKALRVSAAKAEAGGDRDAAVRWISWMLCAVFAAGAAVLWALLAARRRA
jgi:hypothetical protein